MGLPSELISQFAKATSAKREKSERTSYGTIVEKDDKPYVRLDGSDILTPAYTTVAMRKGERVVVMIKNHTAIVTGNLTSPAAQNKDVEKINFDTESASKVATDYIRDEEDLIVMGDLAEDADDSSDVRLDAKSLRFYIKSIMDIYKPYYESGDTINVQWYGVGYTSDTADQVQFTIPLAKPVLGSPNASVSSLSGLQIRQFGSYTHGSGSSTYVQPSYYSASLSGDGGLVNVTAYMRDTTNAYPVQACCITADITVEFS